MLAWLKILAISVTFLMSAFAAKVVKLSCKEIKFLKYLGKLVPPLTDSLHKGQMGRIGIIGGSVDFTGAPYYAASASLKFGGDLSYVFCAKQAAVPIKSYSPELMVTPIWDDESSTSSANSIAAKVIEYFPRLHSLVIGPGLGRQEKVLEAIKAICVKAKEKALPLVLDADALYMLSLSAGNLDIIKGYDKCLITPNKMEFDRLLRASQLTISEEASAAVKVAALAEFLNGPTVLLKGAHDLVCQDGHTVYELEEQGSLRRCGGQGDVLAGCLGTTVHWALNYPCTQEIGEGAHGPGLNAAFLASVVTKMAAEAAFEGSGRSMTTPDILPKIGVALGSIEGSR